MTDCTCEGKIFRYGCPAHDAQGVSAVLFPDTKSNVLVRCGHCGGLKYGDPSLVTSMVGFTGLCACRQDGGSEKA